MVDTNEIERLGVNAIERRFLSMGWIFREQQISDFGVDAHAEPKVDNAPTGQLVALQIKSGKSYFQKRGENFVFRGEQRHLDYWLNHALPVFIILYNPETDLAVWQRVERNLVLEQDDGRWSIEIPPDQVLDEGADHYFRDAISKDPASVRRLRLSLDLPLIREIATRETTTPVFLKLTEWINKSLNFRESVFAFGDPGADPEYEFDTYLPNSDVNRVMNIHYPWLDYEYARPIENFSGEVDEHTLEVSVNALGHASLLVDQFASEGRELEQVMPLRDAAEYSEDSGEFDAAELHRVLDKRRDE